MVSEKEFLGEHHFNMDSKGRITLPARFREELGEGFYVTKGYDKCLSIYDSENWKVFKDKLMKYPDTNKNARFVKRSFLAGVDKPVPDKQGKILISLNHREYAALTKEVVIIGAGDHIEIWDQNNWTAYCSEEAMSLEDAAEALGKMECEK